MAALTAIDCMCYALECEDMAEDPAMSDSRDGLLVLAQRWRELALERRDRQAEAS